MASVCKHCGRERRPHLELEQAGSIAHKFSEDGQLTPVEKKKEIKPGGFTISPDNAMAARLTMILNTKGIITDDELVHVLSGQKAPDAPKPS